VLDLLPDVPAGKLAIAELAGASRLQCDLLKDVLTGMPVIIISTLGIPPIDHPLSRRRMSLDEALR